MKVIALIIMLVCMFLLYRIAYPKQLKQTKTDDFQRKRNVDVSDVVVKTRFVRPVLGQSQTTRTTPEKDDNLEKNPYTFAPEIEARNAVIPIERLDEVFDETNYDELEIEPDELENDFKDFRDEIEDEDAELEQGAELASGMSIEELTEAANAINDPSDEKAEILFKVEKTDMFEQMVSSDEGKAERIKAIIERHFRSQQPEIEIEEDENGDMENIDVSEFLGLIKKR